MNEPNISHRFRGRLFVDSDEYEYTKKKLEGGTISNDNYLTFLSTTKYDSNFIDNLLIISAAAVMSDGAHQEIETKMIYTICDELKIDKIDFRNRMDVELEQIKHSDYETIFNYLKSKLSIKNNENNSLLFESAMHIILSDGIMTMSECRLLADIGEILAVPTAKIIARLGLFLRKENEVLVDVEEVMHWRSLSGLMD